MSVLTPFSLYDYCANPAYPGVVEVRLVTNPLPVADPFDLSLYVEASFVGYRRMTGSRADLFGDILVGPSDAVLPSKTFNWVLNQADSVEVTAALVVVTFPGESPQLVAALEAPRILSSIKPGMALNFQLTSSIVTF